MGGWMRGTKLYYDGYGHLHVMAFFGLVFVSYVVLGVSMKPLLAAPGWRYRAPMLLIFATAVVAFFVPASDGARQRFRSGSPAHWVVGTAPADLAVSQWGGRVGNTHAGVEGDFHLAPGDEAVFFLVEADGAYYSLLLGWSVFRVDGEWADRSSSDLVLGQLSTRNQLGWSSQTFALGACRA